MRFTRTQLFSMFLGGASLILGWIQSQVDNKIIEDYVREEVQRTLEEDHGIKKE